ncbi:GFA family protein [Coralloluteibacterium stylophorae]|uniref:GFA family protein n=1 Tax=Coralloluteibacterium stylophorae TaxID=1776034 RepID=A0A8J8AWD7_9GAMM|nr:GFA family protein [Coralloluteibacterium stylophorae]MBS7455558.1 GFA family protein [Coralloluteibacterium stylophorae]
MLEGGCYCGAVRYATEDEPRNPTVCHCTDCRRVAGAASVAWFSVRRSALRWTAAEPASFRSSPAVERTFCGTCGTCLTWWGRDEAAWIDITIASLDDPDRVPPQDHTFVGERTDWDVIGDGLPRFERTRHG